MKNKENISQKKKYNRREFLKTSAKASASLLFAPNIVRSASTLGLEPINVALLGAGSQGQVLMNACLKIPGIRFKAV